MAGLPDNSIGVPGAAGLVPGVDIPPQLASALTYSLPQRREQQQAGRTVDPGVAGPQDTLDALQLSHLVEHSSQTAPAQAVGTHEAYSQGDQGEAYTEQEFGVWGVGGWVWVYSSVAVYWKTCYPFIQPTGCASLYSSLSACTCCSV